MAFPVIPVITGLFGAVERWQERKAEKSQAKHERDLRVISGEQEADTAATEGMSTSWKDEYLTVLLSTPLIVVFYAAMAGDAQMIERVHLAFRTMGELPDWFRWCFLGVVIGTFGLRGMTKLMKQG